MFVIYGRFLIYLITNKYKKRSNKILITLQENKRKRKTSTIDF